MIRLFHIPDYIIDTSKFTSLLHDKVVGEFEQNFADYVSAKYALALNSATSAIMLMSSALRKQDLMGGSFQVPTMLPPVVCNAILKGGNQIKFTDNIEWVGHSFSIATVYNQWMNKSYEIIDSAHRVDRNQFSECQDDDLLYFSFYPTKVISGCDGGMIVSNDKEKIEILRTLANNGMSQEPNNWERKQSMIGYKAYMNSISCYIANENLKRLDEKKSRLKEIRDIYNSELGLNNTSDHLYRVNRKNREGYMETAKMLNIICGIHYSCCHSSEVFKSNDYLPISQSESKQTLSIPFNEMLTDKEIDTVLKWIK